MPIEVGATAPDFLLRDQNNQPVALSDFRGDRLVLLVFYPLTFTGVCRGELTEIQRNLDVYQSDAVQVLAVSVDSPYAHKVWAMRHGFDFPLLADFWPHGATATAYRVFDTETGVARRATFVVDRAGRVRLSEVNPVGVARDQSRWRAVLADLT